MKFWAWKAENVIFIQISNLVPNSQTNIEAPELQVLCSWTYYSLRLIKQQVNVPARVARVAFPVYAELT